MKADSPAWSASVKGEISIDWRKADGGTETWAHTGKAELMLVEGVLFVDGVGQMLSVPIDRVVRCLVDHQEGGKNDLIVALHEAESRGVISSGTISPVLRSCESLGELRNLIEAGGVWRLRGVGEKRSAELFEFLEFLNYKDNGGE